MSMNRDFLRENGLSDEAIDKVLDKHHEVIGTYKNQLSEVEMYKAQLETANNEITSRDAQLENLQKEAESDENLKKQLEQYKADNEKYQQQLQNTLFETAVKVAVAKEANDPDDILAFLNRESVKVAEDGKTVEGLDVALQDLKARKPYLFTSEQKRVSKTPVKGDTAPPLTVDDIMKIEDTSERLRVISQNDHLF